MMNKSASVDFTSLYGHSPEGMEPEQAAAACSELAVDKVLPYSLSS
jgi:hypothetical protein